MHGPDPPCHAVHSTDTKITTTGKSYRLRKKEAARMKQEEASTEKGK